MPGGRVRARGIAGARPVQGLVEFVRTLGAARLGAMAAVTAALVGVFAFIILRVTAPQMSPVFTDLTPEDSAAVVKDLERQAIPYEIKNDGAIILVPRDRMTRIRMKLAEGGLPKGGGVGYEIFDKSDTLGATSFVQNINHLRALEGELARTIKAIDRVQAARVHLVLPERPLFSRDKVEPSASIVLRVRGALEANQVRSIRHLVASAVNGLKPQRVSIVDEAGNLLADGAAGDVTGGISGSVEERQAGYEKRLKDQVESIVSSVVGPGRARVQLSAEFDFNRITETLDKFDPEGRVLRSSQTREESNASGNQEGQVTVGNELPGAQQNPGSGRRPAGAGAARPEQEVGRNRQLRDLALDQDAGDRRRARQARLGRRAGRRQLHQERQGRDRLPAAHARKSSTASARWCAARSASTRSAATRSRSSICASPNRRPRRSRSRPASLSFLQLTKDDIMRGGRARRDGAARPRRAAVRGAPAGAAHPHRGAAARRPPRPARLRSPARPAARPPPCPMPPRRRSRPARPPR